MIRPLNYRSSTGGLFVSGYLCNRRTEQVIAAAFPRRKEKIEKRREEKRNLSFHGLRVGVFVQVVCPVLLIVITGLLRLFLRKGHILRLLGLGCIVPRGGR